MEIVEFDWNKFFVPITKDENQSIDAYISKVKSVLQKFYETNTASQEYTSISNRIKKATLDDLMYKNTFLEMSLQVNCDVSYQFFPKGFGGYDPGILVWSSMDLREIREPGLNYLREKWSEL